LDSVLVEDGYWKDILALTWEYRLHEGLVEIVKGFEAAAPDFGPRAFRPSPDRVAPRVVRRSARQVIEAFFDFDTNVGQGTGFVRLLFDPTGAGETQAWILLTTLQQLRGFEERIGARRPTGVAFSRNFAGDNWLELRRKAADFRDRDPEVLVIGAGQAGLSLAARLGQLGVDALLIEKQLRVGDNWRSRYHSLTLHNEVWANSLPYIPFPPTWPTFVPKDKLAGWLEAYAEFMELNVWTGTELKSASYDEKAKQWTASLSTEGGERTVRAAHMVVATGGVSGTPNWPSLPGIDDFRGEVLHSSQFVSGVAYRDKRAIVIGTGNSGHDVAQDLYANGAAAVTMVQRSPTAVVSLVPSGTMVYELYAEGPPADDIDLISAAVPYPILEETYKWITKRTCELDKDLLDGLDRIGFEVDFEPDNTGFHMKYLRTGGGYYLNVGCSDLLMAGVIELVKAREIARFIDSGVCLSGGRTIEADLVVLATGFQNQQAEIARLFGNDVADRVGPVWGFDEGYNMRNMWKRTAQKAFWIMGGNLIESRFNSRFLALQIKADLEGLLPS